MTGYVTEVDARTLVSAGFSGVITKPFSIEELATGVRDVLDSR
jgi:CheY-like chemotaxis protein